MSRLPERDRLRAFVLRFVQSFSKHDEITVRAERYEDFVVLFGLLQRVRRLAQAYLRLSTSGYGAEAQVLVRAALEHAVTAQWAYLTVGGVDRLRVDSTRDRVSFIETLGDGFDDSELAAELERARAEVRPGKGMPTWRQIVDATQEPTGFVRKSYKVLSQVTHVTHQANLDAFVIDDDAVALRVEPEDTFDHQVLYALTSCCMLAAWLLAHMAGDETEQGKLHDLSNQLSMPWRLDAWMSVNERRFPDDISTMGTPTDPAL